MFTIQRINPGKCQYICWPYLEALYAMPHDLWCFQGGAANYSSMILSLDQSLFLLLRVSVDMKFVCGLLLLHLTVLRTHLQGIGWNEDLIPASIPFLAFSAIFLRWPFLVEGLFPL